MENVGTCVGADIFFVRLQTGQSVVQRIDRMNSRSAAPYDRFFPVKRDELDKIPVFLFAHREILKALNPPEDRTRIGNQIVRAISKQFGYHLLNSDFQTLHSDLGRMMEVGRTGERGGAGAFFAGLSEEIYGKTGPTPNGSGHRRSHHYYQIGNQIKRFDLNLDQIYIDTVRSDAGAGLSYGAQVLTAVHASLSLTFGALWGESRDRIDAEQTLLLDEKMGLENARFSMN